MTKYKEYLLNRGLIIYAFRYALGRHSYAVSDVVEVMMDLWDELPKHWQELIQKEIGKRITFNNDNYFEVIDNEEWLKVLKLKIKGSKNA